MKIKNKNDIKNIIIIVAFILIIYGSVLLNILLPDTEISYSERRRLLKLPSFNIERLLSGEFFEDYEKYSLDQFPFRDEFRSIKAFTRFNIFNQKDNNHIYLVDGNINKMEYPLNEKAIINAANKLNEVYQKYLHGMNVSYAIIPDKNYFMADKHGYLSMDYDRLIELMVENVQNMNYIDLFSELSLDDYYKTDIHWRQESIVDIAGLLTEKMGDKLKAQSKVYTEKSQYPFYGSYYGQAALKLMPDTLIYLTNEMIENASVYDHIDKTYSKVYIEDKFGTIDSYDLFLSGAKSLLTITNPMSNTDKELIIFRDSFASSIAPLMLQDYAKITLVDLRYLATDLLGSYIDFSKDQDVLFLYNTIILNNSYMLK
ncbi:MAG: hypothetical protein EWM47_13405 [Anaerolineaceae bacterium]|nr:MAG: hypothetical protein EWM47_13405 [Anaerolineaceae bacterium]